MGAAWDYGWGGAAAVWLELLSFGKKKTLSGKCAAVLRDKGDLCSLDIAEKMYALLRE